MSRYLSARGLEWDRGRFLASWSTFENLVVVVGSESAGFLRLFPERNALGLRDLQLFPQLQRQGIGSWAVRQAQSIAKVRGFSRMQLRVYEENPARLLYARLGFKTELMTGGSIHMTWTAPPAEPA